MDVNNAALYQFLMNQGGGGVNNNNFFFQQYAYGQQLQSQPQPFMINNNAVVQVARPSNARLSTGTVATVASSDDDESDDDDDIEDRYWEDDDWVPVMKSGKQRSPNQIRNELQKYIDNSTETQTSIVQNRLNLSYNSFRKFMNPKTYKDQWSATQNSTYWAAAKLLESERNKKNKKTKKPPKTKASTAKTATSGNSNDGNNNKRSIADFFGLTSTSSGIASNKKQKTAGSTTKDAKKEILQLYDRISQVQGVDDGNPPPVYDSCPELVKKVRTSVVSIRKSNVDNNLIGAKQNGVC